MSDRSTPLRRRFALVAALLMAATAFLATSAGPAGAGGPQEFTVIPTSAEVGDTITATSDDSCPTGDSVIGADVMLVDADDNEVFSTTGAIDANGNWSFDIDTTGLDAGTFTVKARCVRGNASYNNYQSKSLTLTAPDVEPTTTTTEAETTTSTTETPTTDVPGTTTTPTVDEEPNAAPAAAVAGSPNYTG